MRRLLPVVAAMLLWAMALPVWAAPPETETIVEKNVTETFVESFTCDPAELYEITITFTHIEHVTTFPDGRVHATFTDTGTFEAEALDPEQPDASGKFAVWGGFNENRQNVSGTFTFNVTGQYEDGTRINTHAVSHFNTRPDGVEFFFERCRD